MTRYDRCLEIARSYGRDLLNPALEDDATEVVGEIASQYLHDAGIENDMYTTGCNFEAALPDAWEAFSQAQHEQEQRRQEERDADALWAALQQPAAPVTVPTVPCAQCGAPMNPVAVMLGPVCTACCKANHKAVATGQGQRAPRKTTRRAR